MGETIFCHPVEGSPIAIRVSPEGMRGRGSTSRARGSLLGGRGWEPGQRLIPPGLGALTEGQALCQGLGILRQTGPALVLDGLMGS